MGRRCLAGLTSALGGGWQGEKRPHPRACYIASVGGQEPDPTMHTARRNTTEKSPDVAAVGDTGTVAQKNTTHDSGRQ